VAISPSGLGSSGRSNALPQLAKYLATASDLWVPQFAQNFAEPFGTSACDLGFFSDLPDTLLPLNFLIH